MAKTDGYGMYSNHIYSPRSTNESISEKLRTQSLVTIEVGPNKTPFTVMKEMLCFRSKYFRKAFESFHGIESKTGKIVLEAVDEATFATFVDWLVAQKLELADGKTTDQINSAEEIALLYVCRQVRHHRPTPRMH